MILAPWFTSSALREPPLTILWAFHPSTITSQIFTFTPTFAHVHTIAIMLYLVGLGLADEKDITVKGLEIVKKAERVYLEAYTAVLLVEKEVLVSWLPYV